MMGYKDNNERAQVEFISLEDLVPANHHLVRKLHFCSFLFCSKKKFTKHKLLA